MAEDRIIQIDSVDALYLSLGARAGEFGWKTSSLLSGRSSHNEVEGKEGQVLSSNWQFKFC